jgi:inner membrane protein
MPSIITHSAVGVAGATLFRSTTSKWKFWFFSIFCSIAPDGDVITFAFGVHYGDFFGHRGFIHSLFFAGLLACVIVTLFFRNEHLSVKARLALAGYFFVLTASHSLLDALTSGGLGIALLSPFENRRFFFPFTPIQVSPIGIH